MLQKKTQKNIMQNGHKLLIIHTEYEQLETLDLEKKFII